MISFLTRSAAALVARVPALSRFMGHTAPTAVNAPPSDGWLPGVLKVESVNRYDASHRPERVRPVEFVVIHYTASPYLSTSPTGSDLTRMERWATRANSPSSTHFIIMRDGRLVQMVSLNARAWHVTSRWPWPGDSKGDINSRSIGIDFENVGWLRERGGRFFTAYGLPSGEPAPHHGPVGHDSSGKPWEPYTAAQIETAVRLLSDLGAAFPQLRDGNPLRLIGHHDAQPTRVDPGPLCPMDRLRAALMGAPGGQASLTLED